MYIRLAFFDTQLITKYSTPFVQTRKLLHRKDINASATQIKYLMNVFKRNKFLYCGNEQEHVINQKCYYFLNFILL